MKFSNLAEYFIYRCKQSPQKNAIGWLENEELKFLSFEAYQQKIQSISAGLSLIGIEKSVKVSILGNTCKEWHFADLATMSLGAVVVPVYHTYSSDEVEYILNHSESQFIFIESKEQLEKLSKISGTVLSKINKIISFKNFEFSEEEAKSNIHQKVISLNEITRLGQEYLKDSPDWLKQIVSITNESDLASIVYTSGTTGRPKGALMSHGAILQMLTNVKLSVRDTFNENDRTLTFLPLSHVFGRCDSLLILVFGWQMVFARSIEKIIHDLEIVRPTIMLAVPRIFEKIYERITNQVDDKGIITKFLFKIALNESKQYFDDIDADIVPSFKNQLSYDLGQKIIFKKIYNKFGGKIRYFVSGGAPLSPQISNIMRVLGFTILEGYGLTETIAPCCLNPIHRQINGTVGKPMGDVELSFDSDGEILIQSKALFSGYYKDEEETKNAFDEQGRFKTGDIGQLNDAGYLKITDRKKDLIITSAGKNVAPQKIENLAKTHKYITHLIVYGDQRKFLTALIGIERENFAPLFEELGLAYDADVDNLSNHPKIRELIKAEIDQINDHLQKYETIKKFTVLPVELSTDNYLTPSLKVKKKLIFKDFSDKIDAMYS